MLGERGRDLQLLPCNLYRIFVLQAQANYTCILSMDEEVMKYQNSKLIHNWSEYLKFTLLLAWCSLELAQVWISLGLRTKIIACESSIIQPSMMKESAHVTCISKALYLDINYFEYRI
jgi:hypothetical protein